MPVIAWKKKLEEKCNTKCLVRIDDHVLEFNLNLGLIFVFLGFVYG